MSWNATIAIRTRRERLGLSQAALAKALGVSKSLLSHFEAGSRQPTTEQIGRLAEVLQLPADLLVVGLGRVPEDIATALNDNPIAFAAAVRASVEAKVINNPTTPSRLLLPRPDLVSIPRHEIPEKVDARKNLSSYRAHSYHTKVPPEAIRPFIRAFTNPGEIVFDPFCGSGMTGVAALMEGRNTLLSDLSPAAVHIAHNYTAPCDVTAYAHALKSIEASVAPTMRWLYRPLGSERTVEYTTWSDVYRCSNCMKSIRYWDAVNEDGGTEADRVRCTSCGLLTRKAELEWIGEIPVQSHTSSGSNRINTHEPTREELALIDEADQTPVPYWMPSISFGPEREMWRAAHQAMGINTVTSFFTNRNLHALSALRHAIANECDGRVREALMFAFTASVNRASKRYQWNAKRPTNVMTGTLYISSLRYEWNVWSLFRRKAADVLRYYRDFPTTRATAEVFQRSATHLDCLPDRSVDMVFMDPPFGSNIFYADSSLLWDSWLGHLTNPAQEIVINKHRNASAGGKSISEYAELMARAFEESARVLKKGGRAVLAFSNSDDKVWNSIQEALAFAGYETDTVHVLNKGQPSIKGVKGRSGKENVTTLDLLVCLKHKKSPQQLAVRFPPPPTFLGEAILRHFAASGNTPQQIDQIYSAAIRAAIEADYSVSGITMPAIAERCRNLGASERSNLWTLKSAASDSPKQDFISGYLTEPTSLPTSTNAKGSGRALGNIRVSGGRNSALYLAHSYHTKVPPEAIAPFIEHYTKPGDVILDPFCGSGMTGVAAAIAGRQCILSDLSPAAIHLAWNHTRPCDPKELGEAFSEISERLSAQFSKLYRTEHTDGTVATIHWTLWSTRHSCPECKKDFLLWEAMERETGRLGKTIDCPRCHDRIKRSGLKTVGSEPAWLSYETATGKRFANEPNTRDLKRTLGFTRANIETWFPETPIGADREMYIRCALQLQKIGAVSDFYTPRNLHALSLIWDEIVRIDDDRIKRALAFAFTNTAWHGTRMRRFNARGGQRPLTGTLYVPQLSIEVNVLEVMKNKISQLQRYYASYGRSITHLPHLLIGNAADLSQIPDSSIDYVFTDPPFGSNIFYADCNLIWESWLGRLTDPAKEAVVNRSLSIDKGGKSLDFYSDVMAGAMREIARVLKPDGWATVVFHNTDAAVWQAIRDAASAAGFEFHDAGSLDRQQQSHKGYKGRSGKEDVAHFDVVFNLRKAPAKVRSAQARPTKELNLVKLVVEVGETPRHAKKGLQGIHAEVMRRLASEGSAEFADYSVIRKIWEQHIRPQAAE
jgi:DNA modification methylase/DNA-binding XRE family transcriptional regulator/DNA-directed RNA polymerase subunit RPC12/RpoP